MFPQSDQTDGDATTAAAEEENDEGFSNVNDENTDVESFREHSNSNEFEVDASFQRYNDTMKRFKKQVSTTSSEIEDEGKQ